MEKILQEICKNKGILGSLIISRDGLIISQECQVSEEVNLLAADIAELMNLSVQLIQDKLNQGSFDLLDIGATKGRILVKSINENTFLIIIADASINLGLLLWELKSKTERLKSII